MLSMPSNVGGGGTIRIVISGYYGCGNTGDEAVLAGILAAFSERAGVEPDAFTVLSANPEATCKSHGTNAAPRMSHTEARRALREADLFLSGGGSLLQDTTSLRSLFYYLWIIRLARSFGRPSMIYAQGMGPLRRPIARRMTAAVLNRVGTITVRDSGSAALLKEIGVSVPPVEITADPAFALSPASNERVAQIVGQAGAPTGIELIGFALRPWPAMSPDKVEAIVSAAKKLSDKQNRHVIFVPMQPPGDTALAEQLAERVGDRASAIRRPLTPSEAVGVVRSLTGLVGMRLHALIFGAMRAVPMAAISYDPKVAQLMDRIGQGERTIPLESLDAEKITESLESAIAAGESYRQPMRERAQEMRNLALLNVDRALGLIHR